MNTRLLTAFMAVALAAPIAALGQKPSDAPASTATESALERLNPTHRKMVEQQAPFYRRFPDGSLWTRKVEADRDALPAKNAKLAAYEKDAPLWYCLTTGESAESEEAILAGLDAKDIEAQLGEGAHLFRGARSMIIEGSEILASYDNEVLLIPVAPEFKDLSEGDPMPLFAGIRKKLVNYTLPQRPGMDAWKFEKAINSNARDRNSFTLKATTIKVLAAPKSRVEHKAVPLTPTDLALALQRHDLAAMVEWSPRKTQKWIPAKTTSTGILSSGFHPIQGKTTTTPGYYQDEWKWFKTETKPAFKPKP